MDQISAADITHELDIDCPKEETRILELIRSGIKTLGKDGAVIGLSGGLDSSICAVLLKNALGKRKVLALLLPERDSASSNHAHARLVAGSLGLRTIEHDLTGVLQQIGIYAIGRKQLKGEAQEQKFTRNIQSSVDRFFGGYYYRDLLSAYYGLETSSTWKLYQKLNKKGLCHDFAFQFTKTRLRMVYLYFYADRFNYAVIGTTDKSEYSTGIYSRHGDGANDIQLLRHLYKTQIRQLARYLQLPPEIIDKPNTGDLYGNLPHATSLGMSYEVLDTLLLAMDKGYPVENLVDIVPPEGIESIRQLVRVADRAKKLPLSIEDVS